MKITYVLVAPGKRTKSSDIFTTKGKASKYQQYKSMVMEGLRSIARPLKMEIYIFLLWSTTIFLGGGVWSMDIPIL